MEQRTLVKTLTAGSEGWRAEADVYESGLLVSLVDGLRAPQLHKVVIVDDDHIQLWLEDVVTTDLEWTEERVVEAAGLLGRMSRLYLGMAEDPPLPIGIPELPDLPTSLGHGNARRRNFLAEGADPHRFVLVDWGRAAWWPVGYDLGALLADYPSPVEEALAAYCEAGFEPEVVSAGYREGLASLKRASDA